MKMRIGFYKLSDIKIKFGNLLSALYFNANIELDNINNKMINSSFLDCFENNEVESFINTPNEQIILTLFPNVVISSTSSKDIGPIYWSGIQYMNLFFNYRIPLRTLFLVCPLKNMVNKFDIYHEMNEIELCKRVISIEYKNNSIVQYYRKSKSLSVRELSLLTNTPEPSIRYYELDNNNLFKANYESIEALKESLLIPNSLLKKQSSFFPFTFSFLKKDDFNDCIKQVLNNYYVVDIPVLEIEFEEKPFIKKGDARLFIGDYSYFYYKGKRKYIDESILNKLLQKALKVYIHKYIAVNLVF